MVLLILISASVFFFRSASIHAVEVGAGFDQANKLYEEGKFSEAAAAYQKLIEAGSSAPALFFNLGNAFFKAGQPGRAVLWYRRAEALAPRDPDVKANLQYIRKNVSSTGSTMGWRVWLRTLSLNEWTTLTVVAAWLWFGLLAVREWKPGLRPSLRGLTAGSGVAVLLLTAALFLAWQDEFRNQPAVIVVSEAVVRRGPLDESQSYFHLRDGAEVTVLDQKDNWLQVSDGMRVGWVRRAQVELVHGSATKPPGNVRANG